MPTSSITGTATITPSASATISTNAQPSVTPTITPTPSVTPLGTNPWKVRLAAASANYLNFQVRERTAVMMLLTWLTLDIQSQQREVVSNHRHS